MDITTWSRRVRDLSDRSVRIATLRDQLIVDLSTIEREIVDLSERSCLLQKVGELLRALLDRFVADQVHDIESIVTDGLQAIFHDQVLKFQAEISAKYNKVSIDFSLRQGDGPLAIEGKPLDSFGGGPSSVASLLLRILTLLRLHRRPVLFLDETLSAVSDEYVDQTGQFLRRLAEQVGVDILLVTHKHSFLDHANAAYRGTETIEMDGSRHLVLKQVRGSS